MRNIGTTLFLAGSLMLVAAPTWADATPATPAPDAPSLQVVCLSPMGPMADLTQVILERLGAIPAIETTIGDKAVKTLFLSPGGKGWAETVTDVASGNACLTAMGPSWKESEFRPVSHRPKAHRPPTIRPVDPIAEAF